MFLGERSTCLQLLTSGCTSNRPAAIEAFPPEDHSKDIEDLDFFADGLLNQGSLGLSWNMRTDTLMFQIADDQEPFTYRGMLSTVNGLYDPLGFLALVSESSPCKQRIGTCHSPKTWRLSGPDGEN